MMSFHASRKCELQEHDCAWNKIEVQFLEIVMVAKMRCKRSCDLITGQSAKKLDIQRKQKR